MSDSLTVGLTETQRNLLLRGLNYVRNSVMLEMREPSPEVTKDRTLRLHEIEMLADTLRVSETSKTKKTPASV